MAGFGGTVKLTGEEAYRQALKAIAADLQNVAAQQKLTAATYDKSDNSLTALSKRSEELKTKLASQQEKVKTLTAALKDYQSQQEKNKSTIQSLQSQLDKEKTKLAEIEKQYGKNSKEYQEQAKAVDALEKELKDLNTQYDKNETTVKKTQAALTSAEADVKKTGTAMDKLAKQAKDAGVELDVMGEQTEDAGNKADKAAKGGFTVFKGVLSNLATQVINKVTDGLKTMAKNVVDAGMEFDTAMSKVQAVSGASADEMVKLTAKAKEMGSTTKFSASESAEAFNYMAMAGWKTEDMLNGIEGIMNLAAASGSDLATTSDIVTDALTAMGYSAADAGRLADVMAAASANANTNVEMMGGTFKYAASVAGSLGYSMDDLAVATGLMANAGIKGEQAGTALRSIMQRLATNTGGATDAMKELGVEVTNADGTMRPLGDVLTDLREAMGGLTDEQKTSTAKTIAGTEAMGGLLSIVNAAPEDYDKLTKAVKDSTGAAEKMAKTMQDNVGGKMTNLKSQLEGIYLTIWKKVEPVISKTIDRISRALRNVDWDKFGDEAAKALEGVADGFKWLLDNKDLVVNAIKMMIGAFVVAKIASFTKAMSDNLGVTQMIADAQRVATATTGTLAATQTTATATTGGLTTATRIFNSVLSSNPIGAVITLLGILTGVIIGVTNAFGDNSNAADENSKKLKEQKEEIEAARESWDQLSKSRQESLNKGLSETAYYQDLANELRTITDENGKVRDGYEKRASFITTTLAEALGIEIKLQDGVVQGYDKIQESIDATIEKKKAEIVLNSQEAQYTEAINQRSEALKRQQELLLEYQQAQEELVNLESEHMEAVRNGNIFWIGSVEDRIAEKTKETNEIQKQYNAQKSLTEEYAWTISQYESNMALFHEQKYDEMSNVSWDYINTLGDVEKAKGEQIRQDIQNEKTWIRTLEGLRNDSNKEMIDAQIEAAKKRQANLQKQMDEYNRTTENELKNNGKSWLDNAATVLSKLSDKKIEFKKTGEGQVQWYEDGMKVGAPMAEKEAEKIAKDTLAEFDQKAEAEGAGKNVITGFTNGEGNMSLQNTAFTTARKFATNILSTLKKKLGIESPSKETASMGRFLVKGMGIGIEKEEDTALKQAEEFGENVLGAINGALDEGLSTNALEALKTAIPAEFNANIGANTSRMAEAAQNADKSLVSYFKQALSEMKIEMDDYEMGQFVDKTVTKLVFA